MEGENDSCHYITKRDFGKGVGLVGLVSGMILDLVGGWVWSLSSGGGYTHTIGIPGFCILGGCFVFFSSSLVSWPAGRRWDYGFFFPLYLHLDGYARSSDVPEYTMATYVETENIYPSSSYTFFILLLSNVQPGL